MLQTQEGPPVVRKSDLVISSEYDVIIERLKILHPTLDTLEIRMAVETAAAQFEGARLKMFVPLLVETSSLLSYEPYLWHRDTVPLPARAVLMLAALLTVGFALLRDAAPGVAIRRRREAPPAPPRARPA